MDSQGTQQVSVTGSVKAGCRSARRRRQPFAWLGASALTLGVGVALAGAGTAHADDSPSVVSATSAKASAPAPIPRGAVRAPGDAVRGVGERSARAQSADKRVAATVAPSRSAVLATVSRRVAAGSAATHSNAVAVPTASAAAGQAAPNADVWAAAVQNPPLSRSFAVAAGAPRLERIYGPASRNPARFGPVLSTVVWALNEAVYQIQGLAPLAKPNQLPSTPGQAQVVGTLNTVAPFGARVKFAVTNAPANGTVTIDSQGFYTYTPNAALAVAGGTDEFAVTATDLGMHLENLFGLPGHTATIIVPVTVAPQSTQAQNAANPVYRVSYHVYNTSWATQTFGAASCNPCNGDAKVLVRPADGAQLQTTQTADYTFEFFNGDLYFTQVVDSSAVVESSATAPNGTLAWNAGQPGLQFFRTGQVFSVFCSPSRGACKVPPNSLQGGDIYFADAPGTVYVVPAANAQQQSDVLQNLVASDLSNAKFYTKSQPTIGYTNPLKVQGFSPYTNNTQDNSTNTYTVTQTTTQTDSYTYQVSVKTTQSAKLGDLSASAEQSAQTTWGTTTANALAYTQTVTQTIRPGYTLYLYTETPVYRYYGDWSVVYGNTTYILNDVWYDSPNPVTGQYPAYLTAYTCQAGSVDCAQLAQGYIPATYPNAWPAGPTYPVAESPPPANAAASSDQTAQRLRWGRLPAVNA